MSKLKSRKNCWRNSTNNMKFWGQYQMPQAYQANKNLPNRFYLLFPSCFWNHLYIPFRFPKYFWPFVRCQSATHRHNVTSPRGTPDFSNTKAPHVTINFIMIRRLSGRISASRNLFGRLGAPLPAHTVVRVTSWESETKHNKPIVISRAFFVRALR